MTIIVLAEDIEESEFKTGGYLARLAERSNNQCFKGNSRSPTIRQSRVDPRTRERPLRRYFWSLRAGGSTQVHAAVKKSIGVVAPSCAIVVVTASVLSSWDFMVDGWYIRKLESATLDERILAANLLAERRSVRGVWAILQRMGEEGEEAAMELIDAYDSNALGEIRAELVGTLLRGLSDDNEWVRVWSAYVCGEIEFPSVQIVRGLIGAASDDVEEVQLSALDSLARFRTRESVSALCALLADTSTSGAVSAKAVGALEQMEDERALMCIVRALNNESDEVRDAAEAALSRVEGERAGPVVREVVGMVRDREDVDLRRRCARILSVLAEDGSVEEEQFGAMITALVGALEDDAADVRQHAAYALQGLEDRAREATAKLVRLVSHDVADVRAKALTVLARVGAPGSSDVLCRALGDDSPLVRRYAVGLLGETEQKSEKVLSGLRKALDDAHELVKVEAARACLWINSGNQRAIEIVIGELGHRSTARRLNAIRIVEECGVGAGEVVAALKKLRNDSDSDVRSAARDALAPH